MDSHEDAERCIKHLNQSVLEGRYVTVERSRRKHARTPTPGHYLGLKNTRDYGSRGDNRDDYRGGNRGDYRGDSRGDYRGDSRGEFRGSSRGDFRGSGRGEFRGDNRGDRGRNYSGSGRGDYPHRRSPRRSPYHGGLDHSPQRSPYVGRSRRQRSRSIPHSPYSPDKSSLWFDGITSFIDSFGPSVVKSFRPVHFACFRSNSFYVLVMAEVEACILHQLVQAKHFRYFTF
ncbi:unnamed protein product [Vicia faba]|uniref:Uncharacterized protein n=1 Tax=Vicia faba TaxID=3906 RepID=A0AAV1AA99_VICFA|nr:unnamed protein product [Vicia faba]